MVFGSFFQKIQDEADADLESLIYYKASFHNYTIVTPKRENLIKHGLSGKVYSFSEGRSGAGANPEKEKLKQYMKNILLAAGVPIDIEASNDGFVNPPNDCMAFDFAECWNTKKSVVFSLPPADYDISEHGPWVGPPLVPFVALAGDALLEPFWPLGLGLKRGWQAIMDTCWAVDNLYNRTCLCERLQKNPDEFSWDDHFDALREQIDKNFEYCSRVQVALDIGTGMYAVDGLVMTQWRKMGKDAESPDFQVEVCPWTRYLAPEKEQNAKYKRTALDDPKWVHPVVRKCLAVAAYKEELKKKGEKSDLHLYSNKKLVSINGRKKGEAAKSSYTFKAPAKAEPKKMAFCPAEVGERAETKRASLVRKVTADQIDQFVTQKKMPCGAVAMPGGNALMAAMQKRANAMNPGASDGSPMGRKGLQKRPSMCGADSALGRTSSSSQVTVTPSFDDTDINTDLMMLGHCPPEDDSALNRVEHMWDRMTESGLTPAQGAELVHIRTQIKALGDSLAAYKQAEMKILTSVRSK